MVIGTLSGPIISFLYVYFVYMFMFLYMYMFFFIFKGRSASLGHLLRRGINPFGIMAILPFFFNFLLYI